MIIQELDLKPFTKQNRMKQMKKTTGKGLKIVTPKQLLQRLPIALAQVRTGNDAELKSEKSFLLCINQKKSLKKYTIT